MPGKHKHSSMTPQELRAIRGTLGLTQTEMAGWLGITFQGYQKFEYGERKIPVTIARLTKLLLVEKNRNLLLADA